MECNLTIEFEVPNPKLISVNDQYMHPVRKCRDGRYRSYTCKAPSLKEFQSFYDQILKDAIFDEDIGLLKKFLVEVPNSGVFLSMEVALPRKELYEHDVSNWIKALEDSISYRTNIDDSKNIKVTIEKKITDDSSWWLFVKIHPYIADIYTREVRSSEKKEC